MEPPESPNGDVQNCSELTNVQTFVPTDRVLNLTKDVLPLNITHQNHTSPVQTSTPAREDPKFYIPGLSSDKVVTSKKSATPVTPLALRCPKRCRQDTYIPLLYVLDMRSQHICITCIY